MSRPWIGLRMALRRPPRAGGPVGVRGPRRAGAGAEAPTARLPPGTRKGFGPLTYRYAARGELPIITDNALRGILGGWDGRRRPRATPVAPGRPAATG